MLVNALSAVNPLFIMPRVHNNIIYLVFTKQLQLMYIFALLLRSWCNSSVVEKYSHIHDLLTVNIKCGRRGVH